MSDEIRVQFKALDQLQIIATRNDGRTLHMPSSFFDEGGNSWIHDMNGMCGKTLTISEWNGWKGGVVWQDNRYGITLPMIAAFPDNPEIDLWPARHRVVVVKHDDDSTFKGIVKSQRSNEVVVAIKSGRSRTVRSDRIVIQYENRVKSWDEFRTLYGETG